ncbi:MAG: hypothetical protein C0399_12250 [Syntrophus sp. (in: bacteria)]|nr:hypothetical protein [Syntrophus sp. (in: bacteria)]MBA4419082.1 hypothetical protein [Syntrophus sp. (in: bacteria)]
MESLIISLIAFVCIFGGALLGMLLGNLLPEHHVSDDSKDVVKLGAGIIATLAALVLGLLISSAKGTYDIMSNELKQTASKIVLIDRVMANYGPETKETRDLLRYYVAANIKRIWSEEKNIVTKVHVGGNGVENIQNKLLQLSPKNDAQRWHQSRALQLSDNIAEARWHLIEQLGQSSLPMPFLVILVLWLTLIFASFGLFSPRNTTVIAVLLLCALSLSGSLFLIQELDRPFQGLIKISSTPLRNALVHLGK